MARTRLTNPVELVELRYNPYLWSFLEARRARVCPNLCQRRDGSHLRWSMIERLTCPSCDAMGARAYYRLFMRAGRQSGKTRGGSLSAVEEATVPNSIGWCAAPTVPELEDYVMPAFFAQLPQTWFEQSEWSEDRKTLILPNGAQVGFRSFDDPNKAVGATLDWLWIDEGRKMQELAWQLARAMLVVRNGACWITSSPDWGEDWCHRNFWQPAEDGVPGFWAASFRTIDNPIINPQTVERDRATMPPELFRREYEASIENPTGTIYGDLVQACAADDDVIRRWIPEWPLISPQRQRIIALDPGSDHPFAMADIVATPFGLVLAHEYEQREKLYKTHARNIFQLVTPLGGQVRWVIDRSQKQAAYELSQYNIFAQGADNDVEAGIQRVYAWLASGQFLISRKNCPLSLRRLQAYRYAEGQENRHGLSRPEPFKKDDDLPDAIRYGLMTWPELPKKGPLLETRDPRRPDPLTLTPRQRWELEQNSEPEPSTDGLVRVTDAFEAVESGFRPMSDGVGSVDCPPIRDGLATRSYPRLRCAPGGTSGRARTHLVHERHHPRARAEDRRAQSRRARGPGDA
jgi:hypothetical protein